MFVKKRIGTIEIEKEITEQPLKNMILFLKKEQKKDRFFRGGTYEYFNYWSWKSRRSAYREPL